ncbi:LytR/AlgR family response regulator transcription factor [Raineya sp.]|jgi:DNA-binding LytR/AlgR family response regulator
MKTLQCLIVDDEPLAIDILAEYVKKTPNLSILTTCLNASEAIEVLGSSSIDILFLDIHLPGLNGFEMLSQLENPPFTILTTAYSEYALQSYEIGKVIDYLLKPFSYERFLKSIQKITQIQQFNKSITETTLKDFVFVKSDKKIHKIDIKNILFIEALGNYLKIYTPEQVILAREKISNLEKLLPNEKFIRTHKSYIIALPYVKFIEGNIIHIDKYSVPIGENYKKILQNVISQNIL